MQKTIHSGWYCFFLTLATIYCFERSGTTLSRAMPEISYTPRQLRVMRPPHALCKQLHRENCERIRVIGCHRRWVSCCRGVRAGRLHRLITSYQQPAQPHSASAMTQLSWEFPTQVPLINDVRNFQLSTTTATTITTTTTQQADTGSLATAAAQCWPPIDVRVADDMLSALPTSTLPLSSTDRRPSSLLSLFQFFPHDLPPDIPQVQVPPQQLSSLQLSMEDCCIFSQNVTSQLFRAGGLEEGSYEGHLLSSQDDVTNPARRRRTETTVQTDHDASSPSQPNERAPTISATTSPSISPQDTNSVLNIDELNVSSQCSSILSQPDLSISTLSDFNLQELFEDEQRVAVLNNDTGNLSYSPNINSDSADSIRDNSIKSPPLSRWLFPIIWLSNIRGGFSSKLDEIASILSANNVNIAAITESWLHDGIDNNLTQIPGYVAYRLDRADGRMGGGIIVFINHSTPCVPVPWLHNPSFEVMWFSFRACRMPRTLTHLLLGVVYHPPAANNLSMNDYLTSCIDQFTRHHPGCGVLILGDFNRLPESSLRAYPLKQVVSSPTRADAILDKIFTNADKWYTAPVILPAVSNSDHFSVLYSPTLSSPQTKGHNVSYYRRSSDPNAKAMLCHAVQKLNWTPVYYMDSVDSQVHYFYNVITSLLDHYLPYIKHTKYSTDKPWVTKQFKHLISQRQRALLFGNRQQYCKLRNRVTRMSRSLRRRYYENKVQALHDADSHSWWKQTKKFLSLTDSDSLEHISIPNGETLANAINSYFVSVSQDLPPIDPKLLDLLTDTELTADFVIEPYEVAEKLSKLNIYKAPGPDEIPTWLLQQCAPYLSEPLAALYNASLKQGVFPEVWKAAEVVPVPKNSPPRCIESDLRPIALLPVVAKIFESFVRKWFMDSLSPTFDALQFGCLRGRSTAHALTSILHLWQSSLDQGHSVRALLIDLSKAFDRVNHNILFKKISERGVPQCLLRWFFSYLSRRQQRTRVKRKTSSWRYLNGSMPQGSLLGPFSFLVLIDDLAPGCQTHKYVDDTTMSEILKSANSPSHMLNFLNAANLWASQNDMKINTNKTKELVLGPWGQHNVTSLETGQGIIERVHQFKLLGVYLDSTLTWTTHIDYITKKATKRLYFLKILKRAGLSPDHLLHYYTAVIRPVLEYCCCVWHHNISNKLALQLENIQKRAMKIIFEHTRGMPYSSALYCANLPSLQHRRDQQARKFFNSILAPDSCLHSLLPAPRDKNLIARLRAARTFPALASRTKRYQSFINFGLLHYQ